MTYSLLYVSQSNLVMPEGVSEVQQIADWSRRENARRGITGALIFTEVNFAQYIEGERVEVVDLMRSISRDARHSGLKILVEGPCETRFRDWTMVYCGPAAFLEREMRPLTLDGTPPPPAAAHDLINLMQAFSSLAVEDGAPTTGPNVLRPDIG